MVLRSIATILAGFLLAVSGGQIASAQTPEMPHWASLRFDETNMRVGPSREYPIDWVYRRKGLPVRVLRSRDEWELVEDPAGTRGWISGSQLSQARTAIVTGADPAAMRKEPAANAAMLWRAAPGVVATLLRCRDDWCEIDIAGRAGWVMASALWGDDEPADQP